MDDLHSWPERIAEREGDYLTPDDLQDLIRYSLSFQERLELYQVLQQQELTWIQKVLQQQEHPSTTVGSPIVTALHGSNPARGGAGGAEPSLTPAQRLLARQLAFCLRSLGLSLLIGDPLPLRQWTCGVMERHLGVPTALQQLQAVVQGSLPADQQGLLAPYWQELQAVCATSQAQSPSPSSSEIEVDLPTVPPERALTLAEMFV
ncbi:MAG TPA: hypothetical protein IGR15_04170 [Synechococcus sp. M44_DOE_062]|nr:hypothetical protein [Synechococcus sp. M44_DOE_062]